MADAKKPSALALSLAALTEEQRKAAIAQTHALYTEHRDHWQVLLDAFEGCGGFLNGEYLWKYPREVDNEYNARKEQARYHNYAKALVNLYVRHVFHKKVVRETTNEDLKAWWENTDGQRTSITTFMKRALRLALATSHTGVLIDKTQDPPTGPAKADEKARPIATLFTPLALLDWRLNRETFTAVKLQECSDQTGLLDEPSKSKRYLLWTNDGWVRVDQDGTILDAGEPNLGLVPFAVLRPEPSAIHPVIGQSLLGNANVIKAAYNRGSEEDEVIRNQSFSVLTCAVPADGDVNKAREQLGSEIGTTRAIVAQGTIEYVTPDTQVPETIRKNIAYLVSEMFRIAHVVLQRDSLDAESAQAIALKHDELNEMLQGVAGECKALEENIARFVLAWQTPGSDVDAAFEAAKVSISYPDEFFVADLLQELEKWANAIKLDLGQTMTGRIKKRAARALEPDLDPPTQEQVDKEIEEIAKKPPMAEQLAAAVRSATLARGGGPQPPIPTSGGAQ